jgi:trk system potassium uptake protein TrkA
LYIIVVGGGKVGYYLTKTLINENQEVLVIEEDARKCARMRDELSANVLQGDGCDVATLAEAGAERADVLVAVTGEDQDNLAACQIAKGKFNVARTIARINNPKNEHVFRLLGIDVTVSSTEVILSQIEQVMPAHALVHLLRLRAVGVSFVEMILQPDSPAIGKPLRSLGLPPDCNLPLVLRNGDTAIVPYGNTMLQAGDHVIAVTTEASERALQTILAGPGGLTTAQ